MLRFNLLDILINVPITLIALTGHELAHAWVSTKQGDPTPRFNGRLTLNPLAHLDLVGTLLMIFTGFGWAKPVTVDPRYYKNQKRGMALTAAAGPLANLVMAFLSLLIYAVIFVVNQKFVPGMTKVTDVSGMILSALAVRNLCFMIFNIIPIPPLDGSKVLGLFLSDRAYYTMLRYENYSMILIAVLSLTGFFSGIIGTGVNAFMNGIMRLLNVFVGLVL